MSTLDIQKLLDKYFEGQTSLEEEARLKQYFQGAHIDPALLPFQPLFQFFESERETGLSPSFESKLMTRIKAEKQARIRRMSTYIARIAAVAVIILGIAIVFPKLQRPDDAMTAINWEQYEPQTEEEALAEATAALQLLASKLNGSTKTATHELGQIKKSATIFK